jgi:hypothetical protein
MALNVPLVPGTHMPLGMVGETFCVEREDIVLSLTTSASKLRGGGKLYLTTLRMCFVPDSPSASFYSIDIPLQGITGSFNFSPRCIAAQE